MERFNEDSHLKVIELYVDITKAGGSSAAGPSQTSSHHTLTMGPETYTGGGGAFDNVDQAYQCGIFDNVDETNMDLTVSLGNDDGSHVDADTFEESDDEDGREVGEISDDGSSDDDAGDSELQHCLISP